MRSHELTLSTAEMLGEKNAAETETRRTIRTALLKKLRLDTTDHTAIWDRIHRLIRQATSLRLHVLTNPSDQHQKRHALALISGAVILASDDERRHLQRFRKMCFEQATVPQRTPLLPLALKAFGPYAYDTPELRRAADKMVSRDYKAIRVTQSRRVIPTDFVLFWNKPGQGLDECSRGLQVNRKPIATKPNTPDGQFLLEVTPRHVQMMRVLQEGAHAIARIQRMSDGTFRIESLESDTSKVSAISTYAKQTRAAQSPGKSPPRRMPSAI